MTTKINVEPDLLQSAEIRPPSAGRIPYPNFDFDKECKGESYLYYFSG
jgi:hypothetical protein